jgi:outer membrane protein
LQAGATYKINNVWSLCGSIATARVKRDMTSTTGGIERKTTIDFRPVVFTVAVGYNFRLRRQ